jgi:hypothetical protein
MSSDRDETEISVLEQSSRLSQTLPSRVLRRDGDPLDTTAILITSAGAGSKSTAEIFTKIWPRGSLERSLGADFRPPGALKSLSSSFSGVDAVSL